MSRSSEAYQAQQEQDNLSGSDMFEAQQWETQENESGMSGMNQTYCSCNPLPQTPLWAKENRRILNEFEALQDAIKGKQG